MEVYFVEDGKIGVLVKGVIFIGNGLDVLIKVLCIGNDLKFDFGIGMCGKVG